MDRAVQDVPHAGSTGRRYAALDALRGLALVSMVTYHATNERITTWLGRLTHTARWVDGAFFFVALSGVVTGLVHRRIVEQRGIAASASKLVRRAGFLYAVHVVLSLGMIAVYSIDRASEIEFTPSWADAGGPLRATANVLFLRLEPNFNDVLPMYVLFLLWAILAIALLRRGAWPAVACLSIAIAVGGRLVGGLALARSTFQVTGWQLLFTGGLLVGWAFERERLRLTPRARSMLVVGAAAVALALLPFAHGAQQRPPLLPAGLGDLSVDKLAGGWVAFGLTGAVLIVVYYAFDKLHRGRLRALLRPLELLGSRGLPGYVAMVLCVLVLDVATSMPRNDGTVVAIIVVCACAEAGALRLDRWRRERRRIQQQLQPFPALAD